jgi:hypothetical protein
MHKIENVELDPILFEPHCGYSPKKHSSWDFCSVYILSVHAVWNMLQVTTTLSQVATMDLDFKLDQSL